MTQIGPEEARNALAGIDQVARRMRNTIAAGSLAPGLMVWGVVWAIGFTVPFFWPASAQWLWHAVLLPAGFIATGLLIVRNIRKRVVQSESDKRLGRQIAAFWLVVFAYATAAALIFRPQDGRDLVTLFVLFFMMAYILMGIWMRSLPLAMIGAGITIATIVGRYWVAPSTFLLWMAIFGGGGLFFPGLYIQWRWR